MFADANGAIWLGYPHAGLATFAHGAWRFYTELEGMNVGNIQVLSSVDDQIWIGGDRGLGRIRTGRFEALPTLNALGGITGLLQGKNGDLWLSASVGAVHIAKSEIGSLALDPTKMPAYEILDYLDGMPGVALGARPLPTVLESDDARIWLVVGDHYASIDPTQHGTNAVPPTVIIGSITDDGRRRAASQSTLTLLANVRNVEIDYTATSLSIPSRVRFKYRLEGLEKDWQDVGMRRGAYYNNLPPGHYVFRVIAANDAGVWNTQGASLSLIVPALFYQTFWFRVLCIALSIALVAAVFSWRLQQNVDRQRKRLEQRMEDRLSERTRIARELHDSLLQGFQGLMFRLQAVRQLLPVRPGDAAQFLDSALQAGDQAINEGREAVQNLRSAVDGHDLCNSLRALGAEVLVELAAQSKPEYNVVVEGQPRALAPAVRDDIYRIVREAVRNAYQHAKAHHIETEVVFGEVDLRLRVRDDGIGVDPQILARGRREGHWGLQGIRERSDSVGGHLNVWSEKNAGTEIELRIAAGVAYAKPPITGLWRLRRRFFSRL
jgi:signal transduction histidine kinase